MAERPTESAEYNFRLAEQFYVKAVVNAGSTVDKAVMEQMLADTSMARGMRDLSVGLRATYILLEEVKGMLKRQGAKK
jgi:hypothetical protein